MYRLVCTHHKAGSTWVRSVMRALAERRGLNWDVHPVTPATVNQPIDRKAVSTVTIIRGGRYKSFKEKVDGPYAAVRVVRDPRDAIVSQYFSWRNSHKYNGQAIVAAREVLNELDQRSGLKWLIEQSKLQQATQLSDWPADRDQTVLNVKYEDLLANFEDKLCEITEHLVLDVDRKEAAELKEQFSFENMTGRKAGTERKDQHLRKGVAGDWRNHFDAELYALFDNTYGPLMDRLGYDREASF